MVEVLAVVHGVGDVTVSEESRPGVPGVYRPVNPPVLRFALHVVGGDGVKEMPNGSWLLESTAVGGADGLLVLLLEALVMQRPVQQRLKIDALANVTQRYRTPFAQVRRVGVRQVAIEPLPVVDGLKSGVGIGM
ncbi:two-component sensor histidine kinase [Babesia caballi]|uniref:Two-component sensor histidine kinase n=1 Tax=Babesia caballi TaxID=5871 RepID=A0AAV4LLH5_BABCB|nr:two-component sensor histidine kinase [Babesia caballi]